MGSSRPRFTGSIDLSGRDDQANLEVAAILVELPADHAARVAFAEGKCTIALTHLLADRKDLNARLMDTYWARTSGALTALLPPVWIREQTAKFSFDGCLKRRHFGLSSCSRPLSTPRPFFRMRSYPCS